MDGAAPLSWSLPLLNSALLLPTGVVGAEDGIDGEIGAAT